MINGGREKLLFWWWHLWDKQKISTAANTKLFLCFDPNLQSSFAWFSSFSFTHSLTFLAYRTLNFYIGYSCAGLACVSSLFELSYQTSWQNINLATTLPPAKKKKKRRRKMERRNSHKRGNAQLMFPSCWVWWEFWQCYGKWIFFSPVHFSCFLTFRMKSSLSVLSR